MANLTNAAYYQVTQEQIDACERIIHENTHQVFYAVKSASEAGVEYKVSYNRQHHVLQCNCKAGSEGNNCWHKRAALAAEQEYQTLKAAERIAAARIEASTQYQQEQREQALYTAQLNLK